MTRIVVAEDQIANGVRRECALCPVALAIRPHLTDGVHVYVGQTDAVFCALDENRDVIGSANLSFPDWVRKKIARFDAGDGMEPFEFELDIPAFMLRE